MFSKSFRKMVSTTAVFFLVRLVAACVVGLVYLILAAGVQYAFVSFFGENTFNYILGGVISLILSATVSGGIGSLLFMFVKGWHVAAIAYAGKIRKSGAPALLVGIKAFGKNIVSFGAIYGIRMLLKNITSDFKTKLWEISSDIPYATTLRGLANHPVVEYLARDVIHYGFDAAVYYVVKYPPQGLDEVPSTALEAIKRYLCTLPGILVSSIQTYIIFRFVPSVLKILCIVWAFFTQGFVSGVLISVLMIPVFYVLDNVFFDPLTMMVFLSAYAKKCKDPLDSSDPVVTAVEKILSGEMGEEETVIESSEDGSIKDTPISSGVPEGTVATDASGFVDVDEVDEGVPGDIFPDTDENILDIAGLVQALQSNSGERRIHPRTRPTPEVSDEGISNDVNAEDIDLEGMDWPSPGQGASPVVEEDPAVQSRRALTNIHTLIRMSDENMDEDPLDIYMGG